MLLTLKSECADHTWTHLQSYGDEPGTPEVTGANRETPENDLTRIKWCFYRKTPWPVAQLKCLYSTACSVGNKQEELEATVLLDSDVLAAITSWWDEFPDWSAAIDG